MFKAFKYLFLVSLYKKAKYSFKMLFVDVVLLILVTLIINDLLSISTGMTVYILLLVKWAVILLLLGLIGLNIFKILNIATNPFEKKEDESAPNSKEELLKDDKKNRILAKEELFTKSDLIIQKYMKTK